MLQLQDTQEWKVLSVRQPWAWLIVTGLKDIENRVWPTTFRGPFLIHASQGMTRDEYDDAELLLSSIGPDKLVARNIRLPAYHELARGGIVGAVEIVDCLQHSDSPWFFGPYGFVLRNAQQLPFFPMPGKLRFFKAPPEFRIAA